MLRRWSPVGLGFLTHMGLGRKEDKEKGKRTKTKQAVDDKTKDAEMQHVALSPLLVFKTLLHLHFTALC